MRKLPPYLYAVFAAILWLAGCARSTQPGTQEKLMVFAAASLSESLPEAANIYLRENPGLQVNFNFAGSQQLRRQIEQGALADVLISADWVHMQALAEEGLAVKPQTLLQNRMVVIIPRSNPAGIHTLADLAKRGKIVLASPSVPAGRYSRQVLENLAGDYGPAYPRQVEARVVSQEENVRQVAAKVALGEADAAIVYQTDVTSDLRSRVAALSIPDERNVTAQYPAAILHGAVDSKQARRFLDYLSSAAARTVFRQYGFQPAGTAD